MAIVSQTYNTTGAFTLSLPAGTTEISYTINGAGGGGSGSDAGSPGATGGTGARVSGTATVPGGSTIRIYVGGGGGGGASSQGGAPGGSGGTSGTSIGGGGGGGNAGSSGSSGGGGGGGGVTYIEIQGISQVIAVAGGGGGAGGAGNDGSGPSGFQFGGSGGTALSTAALNITAGSNAASNGGDGGAGGGGGGGSPGGGAGFTPGGDSDAGGGSGGTSWYNTALHATAPSSSVSGGSGGGQSTAGSSGSVTISYDDADGAPTGVANFPPVNNAPLSTTYTTTTSVTVAGINITVPAAASNGAIIIKNGVNLGSSNTTVNNGDTLALQQTSSAAYNTVVNSVLTFGNPGETVSASWNIITQPEPANLPNPFDFTDVTDQPLSTVITSNAVTITGLTTTANVTSTATSGGAGIPVSLVINGVDTGTNNGTIDNGQTLALRITTPSTVNTLADAFVNVGTGPVVDWQVRTILVEDTGPNPFNFTDVANATSGAVTESNVQTITGINTPSLVSIIPAGFEVNIAGSGWVVPGPATTILNNQTLQARGPAAVAPGASVLSTVTIGSPATGQVSDQWRITTGLAGDTVPDPFSFTDRDNQLENTLVYSNIIFPSGFTASTTVNVTVTAPGLVNEEVSIDGGTTWNPLPFDGGGGNVFAPGNSIQLRVTTGVYGAPAGEITIDIGGTTDIWRVAVLAAAPLNLDTSTWYSTAGIKLDGLAIGTMVPTFRDSQGNWGTLDGELNSRYPGFIECDGRLLDAADYPDLFDVIGNDYGSGPVAGAKNVVTLIPPVFEYVGQFRLPDTRNRRLVGTGVVDGNVPASPSLPTRFAPPGLGGAGSIDRPGSVGGDWYIATVDAAGTLPLEQVEGVPPAVGGTTGQFYSLGAITTDGYTGITGRVPFNVAGNVETTLPALLGSILETPGHTHMMLSGTSLNSTTGLMAWNSRGTLGDGGIDGNRDTSNVYPGGPTAPFLGTGSSPWSGSVSYSNYWASPVESSLQLDNNNNANRKLGAIDVLAQTAQARIYSPAGGTLTHTHYLSTTDFGDPTNVFSWGNVNGAGVKTAGMGGDNTVLVQFTHTEMGSTVSDGTFTLSSSKALIPDVEIQPNRTIPLIQPFFNAKYMIKAY